MKIRTHRRWRIRLVQRAALALAVAAVGAPSALAYQGVGTTLDGGPSLASDWQPPVPVSSLDRFVANDRVHGVEVTPVAQPGPVVDEAFAFEWSTHGVGVGAALLALAAIGLLARERRGSGLAHA